jgi:hypothetical protein
MMTPHFHEEIVRQRRAELVRAARRSELTSEKTERSGLVLAAGRRLGALAAGRTFTLGRRPQPKTRVLGTASS